MDLIKGLTKMEILEIGEPQPQTQKTITVVFHKSDIETPIGRASMFSTILQMIKALEVAFNNQGPIVCKSFINREENQSIVTIEAFRPILE